MIMPERQDWVPRPIDTSGAVVPPELADLIEVLAQHNHDVYARMRIAQGWHYGEVRNDDAKTNPTLVPYPALSETEKEVDRQAAIENVKLILTLGYRIQPGDKRR